MKKASWAAERGMYGYCRSVVDDVPFCGKGYEEKGGVEENEVGNNC